MQSEKVDFLDSLHRSIYNVQALIEETPKRKDHKSYVDHMADNFSCYVRWDSEVFKEYPKLKETVQSINSDLLAMATLDYYKYSKSCLAKIKSFEEQYEELRTKYLNS